MENVIETLQNRGMIESITSPELTKIVESPLKVYCGFDPTADSLHIGNMVSIMTLAHFQRCGHSPFAIMGGATGMIGDPSGKSTERTLLDEATLKKNIKGIEQNLRTVLEKDPTLAKPTFLNNYDWFGAISFINFLRDVGKYFRVGIMLGKESVRARMQTEEGISFTEFSYQLLQAYDFYYLFQHYGVTLEIGGADQWGNIIAGCDFVKKMTGAKVFGMTMPLLTKSDGTKFGKSEKGAIWMSPVKLSPYEFYQHLIRTEDADVIKLLKVLTFIDLEEINRIERDMKKADYVPNTAQKILAEHLTDFLHGKEALVKALQATQGLMPGHVCQVSAADLRPLLTELPSCKMAPADLEQKKLIDAIVEAKFLESKGEVRRLIRNGGLYLNNNKIEDENYTISSQDFIEGQFLLFAFGKKHKAIIEIKMA